MLLTIAGIMLLGTFVIFANSLMSDNVQSAEQNEFIMTAVGLAQSVIDEAKTKSFDESAVGGALLSSPSACSTIGADAGESVPRPDTLAHSVYRSSATFDDVDDYNTYARTVDTPRARGYQVNVRVKYASPVTLDTTVANKTFCKYMVVSVTSPYIHLPNGQQTPITMAYAFTY